MPYTAIETSPDKLGRAAVQALVQRMQDPDSADLELLVNQLETEFEGDLLVVRRHRPDTTARPNSLRAATLLEAAGVDGEKYTGWAFGMGPARVAMLRYGVPDIRMLYDSDIRFLRDPRAAERSQRTWDRLLKTYQS